MNAPTIEEIKEMVRDGTLDAKSRAKQEELTRIFGDLSPTAPAVHVHARELIVAKPRTDIAEIALTQDTALNATEGVPEWLEQNGCYVHKENGQYADVYYRQDQPYVCIALKGFPFS